MNIQKEGRKEARLSALCHLPSGEQTVYVETDAQYKEYLCSERSDAFLVLLLPLAMRLGVDILCDAPVTEELLYQLSNVFIPSISRNSDTLHEIKIIAETAQCLDNVGAVATGCSCGVDSFHAIMKHLNSSFPGMNLTHLCLYYSMVHNPKNDAVFAEEIIRSTAVAQQLSLPLIVIHTNCMDVVPANDWFNNLHTFTGAFIALSLQKLWKVYYYASGYTFAEFSIKNTEKLECSCYDLLTLTYLSTSKLRLYSEGSETSRYDKTKYIAQYPIVQKYLHVCNDKAGNCSSCGKCVRTMICLDSLGLLPQFGKVFDLKKYAKNRNEHLKWLYKSHVRNEVFNDTTYQKMKHESVIQKMAKQDPVWSAITNAKGIYDDGWLSDIFSATSSSKHSGKLTIKIYVSNNTPTNQIQIKINGQKMYDQLLPEGLHEIYIPIVPNTTFQWSLEPSISLVPYERGFSSDVRLLSVLLVEVRVE